MSSKLAPALFAVLTMSLISQSVSADGCCPECGVKVCKATPEKIVVEKTCFSIEEKKVCVKGFRWPWEKCCGPKCGYVRTVCVLKKEKKKCDACGYKWEVTTVDRGCRPGCSLKAHGCRSGKCRMGDCSVGNCQCGNCVDNYNSEQVIYDESALQPVVENSDSEHFPSQPVPPHPIIVEPVPLQLQQ